MLGGRRLLELAALTVTLVAFDGLVAELHGAIFSRSKDAVEVMLNLPICTPVWVLGVFS